MEQAELLAVVAQARSELPHRLSAFERLVQLQFGELRAIASGIVHDHELAGGIAQDALLRILGGLPGLQDVTKYRSWSRRIVVNLANTRYRKEQREAQKRSALAHLLDATDDPPFHGPDADPQLQDLLDVLTLAERTVVSLRIVDDMEFRDIAEVTGEGLSATKMRYYRSLEKLRGAWRDD